MKFKVYPLLFEPIFKERIWGGTKLKHVLNKSISSNLAGESWEISTVENNISIVKNGFFQGQSLDKLIEEFPSEILGEAIHQKFGVQFPLLFKFLDANEDLSIQLHPNDELAKKRHHSFGKTEMWYVIQADDNARIIVGFKEKSSSEEYLRHLKNKTLTTILNEIPVKKGDVFFLETGTIHAIGAGIVIAEIQQTSDITYRIYDWDRVDGQGNQRELHTDLALEAINYDTVTAKKEYQQLENKSNNVVDCLFFKTNFIPLDGQMKFEAKSDVFRVFMCTEGQFEMQYDDEKVIFIQGDTLLIPAVMTNYVLEGKALLLEIFI
jgi:mannose-6-phosphate isomerase